MSNSVEELMRMLVEERAQRESEWVPTNLRNGMERNA